ncbi:two-component sensor histidine kinase [Mangrovactinospora gilvigrisea]|uniref:histidine kinase n=2 Tax=Mangrovactinospora gilvigrisea TaxID=1428644 RepID=A0A1J7BRD6_9ACTN|nr:two-component sensor histidine kinase [Mangrovactinospora gilvigrisea]
MAACVGVTAGLLLAARPLHTPARLLVVAALLVSLALMQLLAHAVAAPLRAMAEAARAMARGDYGRRVQARATASSEIAELAEAFNRMASDLAGVDRHRRELVANVAHELRTPISALQAQLENIVDGVSDPDPGTMKAALEQTERLGRLVAQLLDLSRLDNGVVPLDARWFPVETFLIHVVRQAAVGAQALRPDVRIVLAVRPRGLTAIADRERLHQVVANLLDNACRHSPSGGLVAVSARAGRNTGSLVLEVHDEGPGIPEDERTRVFERFARAEPRPGAASARGGTGLGLAIARWAVSLHGGRIEVAESDRGCRMRVELPGRTPPAPVPAPRRPESAE